MHLSSSHQNAHVHTCAQAHTDMHTHAHTDLHGHTCVHEHMGVPRSVRVPDHPGASQQQPCFPLGCRRRGAAVGLGTRCTERLGGSGGPQACQQLRGSRRTSHCHPRPLLPPLLRLYQQPPNNQDESLEVCLWVEPQT